MLVVSVLECIPGQSCIGFHVAFVNSGDGCLVLEFLGLAVSCASIYMNIDHTSNSTRIDINILK